MEEFGVVFGDHDAEADVFSVEAFERGTVADHEVLADAGVEDVVRGQAWFLDFQEDEVCVGWVGFVCWNLAQGVKETVTFREDQSPGLADVFLVFEHEFTGESSEAVEGPWDLFFFHFFEKFEVSGDSVAEAHSRSGVEFGYAAKYHKVGEFSGEGYSSDCLDVGGEFYVGFVDHYEDVFLGTECEEFS